MSNSDTNLGQRLRMEMKKRGISSAELAKRADVKTSFLYDVISGKSTNPSTIKLARVAESLDVSLAYLAGNEAGSQERPENSTAYLAVPRITVDITADGNRVVTQEHTAEYYYFRKSWVTEHLKTTAATLRLLYIRGDSMDPTLQHDDIVLVDMSRKTPTPPGIFIVFDGLGLSAKRLEYVDRQKTIRLISDNPQYTTYERSVEETVIIGRVVWFAREI
jgi:phage repressor protein C with HTH and peptisase S24 domain